MHHRIALVLLAAGLFAAAPAAAQDKNACPAGLICASDPATVKAALEKAGLKVTQSTDDGGDPMLSANNGYDFDVYFYDCVDHKQCDALRFEIIFAKDPTNTNDLANKWNSSKRFIQMSVTPEGKLRAAYDLSTIGGITPANFADVMDWWQTMSNELDKFFKAQTPPAS
jgi:hypothetical protein